MSILDGSKCRPFLCLININEIIIPSHVKSKIPQTVENLRNSFLNPVWVGLQPDNFILYDFLFYVNYFLPIF